MLTQIIILTVVIAMALGSFLVYKRLNRTYYIEYTESSTSDYKVHYRENAYFEDEWLGAGQSYVSSLADDIRTDFHYELHMDTSNVAFDYTYELTAQMVISDKTSGAHIYDPTEVIIPKTTKSVRGEDRFYVDESAIIDFAAYNHTATQFINVYGLKNAKAALWVTLKVDVLSASDEFDMSNENSHSVTMLIPLCDVNFSIENMTSLPDGESKILACKTNGNQKLFLGGAVSLGALALLLLIVLMVFAYLTKNEDITYANRVRKILNSYRSFIQRIYGEFDATGYQLVQIKTFTELLGIRDTIQSPVLMSENKDETRAQFLIPTNTKILYLYELKVDNYDELYGAHPEWVEESAVKVMAESAPKAEVVTKVVELEPVTEPVVEMVAPAEAIEYEQQNRVIIDLYAELERLRREMQESKEQKIEYVQTVPVAGGCMKFGHFSAGRDVNIHYHEMPTEDDLKKAKRMFADDKSDVYTVEKSEPEAPKAQTVLSEEPVKAEPAKEEAPEEAVQTAPVADEDIFELVPDEAEPEMEVELVIEPIEEPMVESEPAVEEAVAEEPKTEESVAEEAVAEEPAVEEATVEETVVEEATVEEPKAEEPKAEESQEDAALEEELAMLTPEEIAEVLALTDEVIELMPNAEEQAGEGDDDAESDGSIVFYDENNNKLSITCHRSNLANIIQSENETTKSFYNELKNYILSFKGVRARMSWRHESFNKGRQQLFKMKIRGKTICMYCALNPEDFDFNKYYHKTADAKVYEQVPMMVKVKSPGALKKAKKLVDAVMERFALVPNAKYVAEDFVALHPYERTQSLIDRGLIKILVPEGYVVVDPRHIIKAEAMKRALEARAARAAQMREKRRLEKEAKLAEKARLENEAKLSEGKTDESDNAKS